MSSPLPNLLVKICCQGTSSETKDEFFSSSGNHVSKHDNRNDNREEPFSERHHSSMNSIRISRSSSRGRSNSSYGSVGSNTSQINSVNAESNISFVLDTGSYGRSEIPAHNYYSDYNRNVVSNDYIRVWESVEKPQHNSLYTGWDQSSEIDETTNNEKNQNTLAKPDFIAVDLNITPSPFYKERMRNSTFSNSSNCITSEIRICQSIVLLVHDYFYGRLEKEVFKRVLKRGIRFESIDFNLKTITIKMRATSLMDNECNGNGITTYPVDRLYSNEHYTEDTISDSRRSCDSSYYYSVVGSTGRGPSSGKVPTSGSGLRRYESNRRSNQNEDEPEVVLTILRLEGQYWFNPDHHDHRLRAPNRDMTSHSSIGIALDGIALDGEEDGEPELTQWTLWFDTGMV